jgi:hypothetical protein
MLGRMSAGWRVAWACAWLAAVAPAAALVPEAEKEKPPPAVPTWNLSERVEQQLARSRALAGSRIEAAEEDGQVSLVGEVRAASQRDRALRIASRTLGVRGVRDRLSVRPGLAEPVARPDEDVARDVARALAARLVPEAEPDQDWLFGWRVEGDGWSIDVSVDDGDVLLEGSALLQQHIHTSILEARKVPGVRSVRSEIELRPNPVREDPVHS